MLSTSGLSFGYNKGQRFAFPDIKLEKGEKLLVLGRSGIGKSTLLHLIAGLMPINHGQILVNNTNINELKSQKLDLFRGKNIGIIFQKNYFIDALNVYENIAIAQSMIGNIVDKKLILSILEDLGIASKVNQPINGLSQGERQRVSIARAVVNKPALILADEPTSALDDFHCQEVIKLLKKQADKHRSALVIVTHDQRLKQHVGNFVILNNGK